MNPTKPHPVIEELLTAAVSEMEDIALRCSDAAEHLEDGKLVGALGALSGCEQRIREAAIVIRAAQKWKEKLGQTSTSAFAEKEEPVQGPGTEEAQDSVPSESDGTNTNQKGGN
jgi:hypothetical protein